MPNLDLKKFSKSSKNYIPKCYKRKHKYIIITGGVLSGLGKGIVTASIGKLLQSQGYKVVPLKIDPYLNVDAGTMNPYEHGEVFVLEDGSEVDMDLGTYERFLGINLTGKNNLTTGKIYQSVIKKERKGEYLGKTVQIIPHLTGEIKEKIRELAMGYDIEVIEIGGTVGDIEASIFLEAVRELRLEEGKENVMFIHVTLVPYLETVREQKTKPTQSSVKRLMEAGIQPDLIIGRSNRKLTKSVKEKISLFCNVPVEAVISDPDVENIYQIPLILKEEGVDKIIQKHLRLNGESDLSEWARLVERMKEADKEVTIALAGKYTGVRYAYTSILEALKHAGAWLKTKVNVKFIETTRLKEVSLDVDGLIVPGGFGVRGTEGKINCIKYARENEIPFLGLCFGMQLAVVEFARNVCGLKGANSTEIDPNTPHPVIDLLPEQKKIDKLGGTMRLGAWPAILKAGTLVRKIYGKEKIIERHRHRYELNPKYIDILEENGLVLSGISPKANLVEFIELPNHPFFVGTQAHPEFKSRPLNPAPLFREFLKALK